MAKLLEEQRDPRGRADKAAAALKERFREIDKDRNGMLDIDELAQLLGGQGDEAMSRKEAEALMTAIDKDGSGLVSFAEFVDFIFFSSDEQHQGAPGWQGQLLLGSAVDREEIRRDLIAGSKSTNRFKGDMFVFGGTEDEKTGGTYRLSVAGDWIVQSSVGETPKDSGMNGHTMFDMKTREGVRRWLFYGTSLKGDIEGWFISTEAPVPGEPVEKYLVCNPSPFATTPDFCCATWQTQDGRRPKRFFVEHVSRLAGLGGSSIAQDFPAESCLNIEVWDDELDSDDSDYEPPEDPELEDFDWEAEWKAEAGEFDIIDDSDCSEGSLSGSSTPRQLSRATTTPSVRTADEARAASKTQADAERRAGSKQSSNAAAEARTGSKEQPSGRSGSKQNPGGEARAGSKSQAGAERRGSSKLQRTRTQEEEPMSKTNTTTSAASKQASMLQRRKSCEVDEEGEDKKKKRPRASRRATVMETSVQKVAPGFKVIRRSSMGCNTFMGSMGSMGATSSIGGSDAGGPNVSQTKSTASRRSSSDKLKAVKEPEEDGDGKHTDPDFPPSGSSLGDLQHASSSASSSSTGVPSTSSSGGEGKAAPTAGKQKKEAEAGAKLPGGAKPPGNVKPTPQVDGWMRLSKMHEDPCLTKRVVPDNVIARSAAGNFWFLSALAAAAEYPGWISSMFGRTTKLTDDGKYTVRMYHPGRKEFLRIEVDDYVPVCKGAPLFAGITGEGEIWPALVEKAFAKMCRSYANTMGGSDMYGLLYVVGGGSAECWSRCDPERDSQARECNWSMSKTEWRGLQEVYINRARAEGVVESIKQRDACQIWKMLRKYMELCYPVSCGVDSTRVGECGLLADRSYNLIGAREVPALDGCLRMVFLRNPFGTKEWRGRWSNSSTTWDENPAARETLHFAPTKDGTFWMSYTEFLKHFKTISVARKTMPVQGCNPTKLHGLKRGLGMATS